jgi:phage shock protein PspC (stress-responsive transcriptional regulator)
MEARDERWYRGSDRILGGVSSGLAAGFHVDPLWVRIAFVVLAFVQGVGILLYLILWLVMPERVEGQAAGRSGFDSMMGDVRRAWDELRGQFGWKPLTATGAASSPSTAPRSAWSSPSMVVGLVLVIAGSVFLADNLGLVSWDVIWPAILIAIGVFLLARTFAKRS